MILVLATCPMRVLATYRNQLQIEVCRAHICAVTPSMGILAAFIERQASVWVV